jgi:hypothetical protein
MLKTPLCRLLVAVALLAARPAEAQSSPFSCVLRGSYAFLEQFQTFSGFRWIECVVGLETADIEWVAVNDGNCQIFDWPTGRTFYSGETFNVPYACLSPVRIAITANGVTSVSRLR